MKLNAPYVGVKKLPRGRKRNSATVRTRVAEWLRIRCLKSKTGAIHVDPEKIARSLNCCVLSIYRACASIRGRDVQWLRTHHILILADFQHGAGEKGCGRRRLLAFHAKTLAQAKVWPYAGEKDRHMRTLWGKDGMRITPEYLAHLFQLADGIDTNQLPSIYCAKSLWSAAGRGLAPKNRRQLTLLRPSFQECQANHNKVPLTGDREGKYRGFQRVRAISWFCASRIVDLMPPGCAADPYSVAGWVRHWIEEGINRENVFAAVQQATNIVSAKRTETKNLPGRILFEADAILVRDPIFTACPSRGQRIAMMYRTLEENAKPST